MFLYFALPCLLVLYSTAPTFAQADSEDLAPSVVARLQQQIVNGSLEEKRAALFDIRNLRSASASRIAVPALRDKEPIVRASAAASVVFLPKNESAMSLIPLLNDKMEFVRREAAYALGDVQDRAATVPLVRMMRSDKIQEVRTAAAVALGKIGDTSAINGLLRILQTRPREDDEFLRRSAARSIGQIAQITVTGNSDVLTPQNFLPEKFKDLGSSDVTGAIPQEFAKAREVLSDVLQSKRESDDTRREAAFSLGAVGDKSSIPVLQTYVTAADPYLAEICKEALLKIERRTKVAGLSD
ncbi:MAG: HEAT repeat domain-containing protein [Acidobacteriota bacterium]